MLAAFKRRAAGRSPESGRQLAKVGDPCLAGLAARNVARDFSGWGEVACHDEEQQFGV